MAHREASTFDTVLPLQKRSGLGRSNWGFVAGKTRTYFAWDSWRRPYNLERPRMVSRSAALGWHALPAAEVDLIRAVDGKALKKLV